MAGEQDAVSAPVGTAVFAGWGPYRLSWYLLMPPEESPGGICVSRGSNRGQQAGAVILSAMTEWGEVND